MKIACVCTNPACDKIFERWAFEIAQGRDKFCSTRCAAAVNGPKLRTLVEVTCQNPSCGRSFPAKPSTIKRGGGKYCSPECFFPNMPARDLALRFWEKVAICSHGLDCVFCCWPWLGSRHRQGYGTISVKIDGVWKDIGSHRVAWELLNQQPFPPGMYALHYCDFEPCNNGMHIHPGTQKQNVQEAIERGRYRFVNHLHGESHPNVKVTENQVIAMRIMRRQGYQLKEIQAVFPFAIGTIHSIVTRRSWTHIP